MTFAYRLMSLACLLVALAVPAAAQSPFATVARVNEGVVTAHELDQRIRFLTLLQAPREVREEALDQLIDERLQLQAARQEGVTVSEEAIADGMAEFAGRADLSVPEFIGALAEAGVSEQAFRDFVRAGIAWRRTVQTRFGSQVAIEEEEVERLVREGDQGGLRVLLSEIVLPANTPERAEQAGALAAELSQIAGLQEFAAAARRYSAAPTAERGGRVDWRPLDSLPPPVAEQILTLNPGEVTDPIEVQNAVALFQLRALDESAADESNAVLDYAQYLIPGAGSQSARQEAARVAARVDTCDDLYGVAEGQPESRLQRNEAPASQIPAEIARQLSALDAGEISTALTRGDAQVLLMLCSRDLSGVAEADLEQARNAALNQLRGARLSARADAYLAELRADAVIQRSE